MVLDLAAIHYREILTTFWSLCCLFFLDIRILIASLVSSNSSYTKLPSITKQDIIPSKDFYYERLQMFCPEG
jgi:hypothetical protein